MSRAAENVRGDLLRRIVKPANYSVDMVIAPLKTKLFSLRDSSKVTKGGIEEESRLSFPSTFACTAIRSPTVKTSFFVPKGDIFSNVKTVDLTWGMNATVKETVDKQSVNQRSVDVRLTDPAGVASTCAALTMCGVVSNCGLMDFSPDVRRLEPESWGSTLRLYVIHLICNHVDARRVTADLQTRVPLVRSSEQLSGPRCSVGPAALKTAVSLLAAAGGAKDADVEILGYFNRVPILSAGRIELDKGSGCLNVFLRPLGANMVQSDDRAVFSIAFGRVLGSAGIVRVLIPNKNSRIAKTD